MAGLDFKVVILLHTILIGFLADARSANIQLEKSASIDQRTKSRTHDAYDDGSSTNGGDNNDINDYTPVELLPTGEESSVMEAPPTKDENPNSRSYVSKSIIGVDERFPVQTANHDFYKSLVYFSTECTGIFVGEHHVLTSADCVSIVLNKKMISRVKNMAHAEGSFTVPIQDNQKVRTFAIQKILLTEGYRIKQWKEHNFAIIVTDKRSDNYVSIGWLKENVKNSAISVVGYPGDKIERKKITNDKGESIKKKTFNMFISFGEITSRSDFELFHDCDTRRQVGSPIYNPGNKVIYGVHTGYDDVRQKNRGVRITEQVYNFIQVMIDTTK